MRRQKALWAVVATLSAPAGIALGKFHLIAPTPGAFFSLGMLATLSLGGIALGIRDARRIARAGLSIHNERIPIGSTAEHGRKLSVRSLPFGYDPGSSFSWPPSDRKRGAGGPQ